MTEKSYNHAIKNCLNELMNSDSKVLLLGLGITDPKGFFDTTTGLCDKYGNERVIECPTSENGYLGHALGLSLGGFRPIVHFQRMDFMLYAFDQLVNNIAKWKSMFNFSQDLPLVIRCLIGMGWGQGAQHSQNFAYLFSQIPGLKVVAPTCPQSASFMLNKSVYNKDPVVFIEHRWLQSLKQNSWKNDDRHFEAEKAVLRKTGTKLSVITWSYSTVEALRFSELYPEFDLEIIDLLYLSPIDFNTILKSVSKTTKVLFWEPSTIKASFASEITALLHKEIPNCKFYQLNYPFSYPASSPLLNLDYYPSIEKILTLFNQIFELNVPMKAAQWPVDKDLNGWTPWT